MLCCLKSMQFTRIKYSELTAKQKEIYNFQKVSAILADYGFITIKLDNDWQGADFIAQHIGGEIFLKVQLKGRLTLDKKYVGKNILICFPDKEVWYLYDHDQMLSTVPGTWTESSSWKKEGLFSWNTLSKKMLAILSNYKL